jgi:predicted DNA-binding antitoxin AbrB/MazE fold protein
MEGLQIDAVYEKATLKLPRELPLVEGATVTITIHPPRRAGVIDHLRIPWAGSREELERLAMGPEFGIEESS